MKFIYKANTILFIAICLLFSTASFAQFSGGSGGGNVYNDLQASKVTLYTTPGSYSQTQLHRNGSTQVYADQYMDGFKYMMATVQDPVGGNSFDSLTVSVSVFNSQQINNTARPFVSRQYAINPISNGPATITFYYSQSDFDSYNLFALYNSKLPLNEVDSLNNKANLRLFRSNGSFESANLVSVNSPSVTWNSTDSFWVVTFTISDTVRGNYFVSTPFLSDKMVSTISHICPTPSDCQTTATATINWNAVSGAQDYRFRFRPQGVSNWNVSTIVPNSRTMSYLSFNTTYEVQLRVRESAIAQGEYTTTYTFTTPPAPNYPICNAPISPTHQVISNSAAVVQWNAAPNGATYLVELKLASSTNWGGTTITGNSYTFNALSPNTTYNYRVRTNCSTGTSCVPYSNYSNTGSFTTLPANSLPVCTPPTNLSVSNLSSTTGTISWIQSNNAQSYLVQMKLASSNVWGGGSTTSNTYSFANLSPNTVYEYRVRSSCTPGTTSNANSAFTSISTFTTPAANVLPVCLPPTNLSVTDLTASSALLTWSQANNAQSYLVQTKLASSTEWGGGTISATSYSLTNLTPNTTYNYRIRSSCAPGTTSNANSAFTTIGSLTTNSLPNSALFAPQEPVWSVYPNPTQNDLNITFMAKDTDPVYCQFFDLAGRQLKTLVFETSEGYNKVNISIGDIVSGTYTLKVIQNNSPILIKRIQKM